MSGERLSPQQRAALDALRNRNVTEPDGSAITSTETNLVDRYNLFIHWQTAEALERRGLVKIHDQDRWSDEGYDITIVVSVERLESKEEGLSDWVSPQEHLRKTADALDALGDLCEKMNAKGSPQPKDAAGWKEDFEELWAGLQAVLREAP